MHCILGLVCIHGGGGGGGGGSGGGGDGGGGGGDDGGVGDSGGNGGVIRFFFCIMSFFVHLFVVIGYLLKSKDVKNNYKIGQSFETLTICMCFGVHVFCKASKIYFCSIWRQVYVGVFNNLYGSY